MKFYGNKPPCFYFNDDTGFSCTLIADKDAAALLNLEDYKRL